MSLIVPILLRCFAVSPAPTFVLRGAAAGTVSPAPTLALRCSAGHSVWRSLRRVAVVVSAPASFTLGFPGVAVGSFLGGLAVRAGGLLVFLAALPSWLRSVLLGSFISFRAWSAFRASPAAAGLTRRSTSLPSVAGRCAIKPRSAG
jgi:hypothetical protein